MGSGGLKSQNFDFLTQKFKMAQNGSNSSQTHLKNSKWLKMAQTHLKMAQTHLKLKMAQTYLKLISNSSQKFKMAQNGSNSSQNGSNSSQNFDFLTQKFKMAQNGSNSSQIIQWSSGGYITIHFRGLRGLRRAQKPKF